MTASVLDFIPQSYHAAILAGTSEVDVAPYLNSGLNAKRILELPPFGQMSIGSSVFIPSGGGLVGANFGCTIKALPSLGNQPLIRNSNAHPDDFNSRDRNIVIERIRLDGNHGNNHSATVFSHGVQLFAVDGAKLDVWVLNVKGDGVGLDASFASNIIGCSHVTGKIRTQSCQRNGVSITCAEQVDVDVYDTGSKAFICVLTCAITSSAMYSFGCFPLELGTAAISQAEPALPAREREARPPTSRWISRFSTRAAKGSSGGM